MIYENFEEIFARFVLVRKFTAELQACFAHYHFVLTRRWPDQGCARKMPCRYRISNDFCL